MRQPNVRWSHRYTVELSRHGEL